MWLFLTFLFLIDTTIEARMNAHVRGNYFYRVVNEGCAFVHNRIVNHSKRAQWTPLVSWGGSSFFGTNNGIRLKRYPVSSRKKKFVGSNNLMMMPEGPEVRVMVDRLQPAVGCRLVNFRFLSGRYATGEKPVGWSQFSSTMTPLQNLENLQSISDADIILDWKCKGKFVYLLLDQGNKAPNPLGDDWQRSIWFTLGMTGCILLRSVQDQAGDQQQEHARWYLELAHPIRKERFFIYYYDQRNFGTLRFCHSRQDLTRKLQSLGPDILDIASTTAQDFVNICQNQKAQLNICRLLMDQSKLSGVGNYILAEGLYRASIDPFASLSELNTTQQIELFTQLQAVAKESYESQIQPETKKSFELQCYGRKTCQRGEPVLRAFNGPHERTLWFTERQLFRPLHKRYRKLPERPNRSENRYTTEKGVSANQPSQRLRIVSFNVANGVPSQMAPSSWTNKDQFTAIQQELLLRNPRLNGDNALPCVIALQECPSPNWWMEPDLGFDNHYISVGSTASHSGYVTLLVRSDWDANPVKLPLGFPAVAAQIDFSLPLESNTKNRLDKGKIFVASVHMEPFQFAPNVLLRKQQLGTLLKHDDGGKVSPSTSRIIVGDMNMRQSEDQDAEENWCDAWKVAGGDPSEKFSWNTRLNRYYGDSTRAYTARYDRLYFTTNTNNNNQIDIRVPLFRLIANQPLTNSKHYLSDHFGLWVDLELVFSTHHRHDAESNNDNDEAQRSWQQLQPLPEEQLGSPKQVISPALPSTVDTKHTRQENTKSTGMAAAAATLRSGIADKSWLRALGQYLDSNRFAELARFVQEERNSAEVYPPTKQVFASLNTCPLDKVKVVILGQDPYHGPGQAHGLAFSVQRGLRPLPPSLKNIFLELEQEGLIIDIASASQHGNLQKWADQGVLLLNTVLTVRAGQPNSHAGRGWEEFTDAVIQALTTNNDRSLVFLLWGNPAARKAIQVIDPGKHVVIQTSHPSPLSATRTKTPFLGSGCFRKANQALEEMGQDPIDWKLD